MKSTIERGTVRFFYREQKTGWNINKIHAALCIGASALTSIGLIAWAVRAFL